MTKTVDSAGFDLTGVRRTATHGNPLTGPFFVEGAETGDALEVRIGACSPKDWERRNSPLSPCGMRRGTPCNQPWPVLSMNDTATATTHEVSVCQVEKWTARKAKNPHNTLLKTRVRELLSARANSG